MKLMPEIQGIPLLLVGLKNYRVLAKIKKTENLPRPHAQLIY